MEDEISFWGKRQEVFRTKILNDTRSLFLDQVVNWVILPLDRGTPFLVLLLRGVAANQHNSFRVRLTPWLKDDIYIYGDIPFGKLT